VPRSVLIVGSQRTESLESSYARAFRHLNWTVHFWEPTSALYRVARGYQIGKLFSTFVHVEPWLRKSNLEFLTLVNDLSPDLIIIIGTSGVRAGTLAQIKVRLPKILIYCIYPDSPHNFNSDRINCLPFFDRVTSSSPAWIESFNKLGAKRAFYLPFAADTHIHYPTSLHNPNYKNKMAHDVVFIGTWRPEREQFLEQISDLDLVIWGSDYWKRRTRPGSPLKVRWGGRQLIGKEFAQVCSESKILLNIMDVVTWPGPNMRTFELPACRAFPLTTRTPAVLELFREGETIECFDSIEEAREKIVYYLEHETARRKIAEASYNFVVREGHTYIDRVRQLIKWVNDDKASKQ
jgi:spore maturation protein CgeB